MVGGINLTPEQSLDAQIARIKTVGVMLQPGEPFQSEAQASSVSSLVSAASASSPTASASTATTGITTSQPQKRSGLSAGVIAGVAVACLAVLALLFTLVWFWGRNKTLREMLDLVRKREEVVVDGYNESGVAVQRRRSMYQRHSEIGGVDAAGAAVASGRRDDASPTTALVSPLDGAGSLARLEAVELDGKPTISEVSGDEPARAEMEGVSARGLLVDIDEKDEEVGVGRG